MVEAHKSRKNDQINSKSTSDRQSNCKSTSERQSNLVFVWSILTSTNYRVVSWFSRGLVVLVWSRESSRAVMRRSRNATLTSPVEIRCNVCKPNCSSGTIKTIQSQEIGSIKTEKEKYNHRNKAAAYSLWASLTSARCEKQKIPF